MAAEISAGAAVATVALSQAKPVLLDPLRKRIVSTEKLKEILDALKVDFGVLDSARKDYENEVETQKTKVPSESYKQWIRRVKETEQQVKELEAKYDTERSSFRFSPSRYALLRQMEKKRLQVCSLLEERDQLKDKLFANPKLDRVIKQEAPEIKKFETLQKPLEQILDLLKGDKVNGIGIRGPLGIGKTTIMKNLNDHEEVATMFDIVIWVKVSTEGSSKNLSRENLQHQIAQRLKIPMGGQSNPDEVSETISRVLKGTSYLLLLDDVKEDLNLYQMGIPNQSNGSKFVLTTRLHQHCSPKVDRLIEVTYLSPDEGWKMFQNVLDNPKLIKNRIISALALQVCDECSGLPLLIEKVANTFKLKNSEHVWFDGLNSWRKWPEKECEGIWEMYKLLKFCYDDLDDDLRKKCFLYSALYPEGSDIYTSYLLECWAAEHFLGNDRDATKVNGHLILSHLMNVSLFEKSKRKNHITMHKFIRQVALHISKDDPECNYLVETSRAEAPDLEYWPEKNRISLCDNEFDTLPDSPSCSMLSTLFLQKNFGLKIIPESFFELMFNLRVLDLSYTGIMSLPSSLSTLLSLEILYLHNCRHLLELPSHIVKLEKLEALDIRRSGINNIPAHIKNLIRLRRLRVSFTESFDYNMISKLSSLEELVIDVQSSNQWSNEMVHDIIKQVATLQKLKTLQFWFFNEVVNVIQITPKTLRICIPEATILESFIKRKNIQGIKSFQFFIGCQNLEDSQIPDFVRPKKCVKYHNGAGNNFPIPEILVETDAFELVDHKDIKHLPDWVIASMNKVRACLIESCDTIETIMSTVDSELLSKLEHLYVKNLPRLESIWKGPVQHGSLAKLTSLVVTNCQMLVKIFPPGVIQQLCEIQYLKIEGCQGIEEIVAESEAVGNPHVLPNLKKLILLNMPKLRSICATESLEWPSLKKLKIFKCPNLRKLPFNKDNAKELVLIKVEQQWWEKLQWQNQEVEIQRRLQKLCTLSS